MKSKNHSLFIIVIVFAVLLGSCVSQKKYDKSLARISSLQADSARLEMDKRKLIAEKLGIEADKAVTEYSLTQQILIKQEELKAKEALLGQREQKLNEFQRIIAKQSERIYKMQYSIKEALVGFKPEELTISIVDGKIYVSLQEKLLFKTASAKVDAKGKDALGKLASVLNDHNDFEVVIEGHTDTVPISKKYDDNWDLSVNRAISIARILEYDYKVDPRRMIASGRGEFYPVATNSTAEGRAKNRRTEIIILPDFKELYELVR